jgi:hypothetical protein
MLCCYINVLSFDINSIGGGFSSSIVACDEDTVLVEVKSMVVSATKSEVVVLFTVLLAARGSVSSGVVSLSTSFQEYPSTLLRESLEHFPDRALYVAFRFSNSARSDHSV